MSCLFCLLVCLLLHFDQCLTRPAGPARAKRTAADLDSDPASILLNVTLVTREGESGCFGGTTAGLCSNGIRLEYRSNATDYRWLDLEEDIPVSNVSVAVSLPAAMLEGCVEFRLIQEEHGGGACNCWDVTALQLNSTQLALPPPPGCDDSASVPRCVEWTNLPSVTFCPGAVASLERPFNSISCSVSEPHINVSFTFDFDNCNQLNARNEGVELSLRLEGGVEWIPVAYYFHAGASTTDNNNLFIGTVVNDILIMRGYQVVQVEVPAGDSSPFSIQVCDLSGPVQFRWLQSGLITARAGVYSDIWILDEVEIRYQDESGEQRSLLQDSFNGPLNTTVWPESNIRNGMVSDTSTLDPDECLPQNAESALVFGLGSLDNDGGLRRIVSRSVKTTLLSLTPEVTTILPTTEATSTPLTTPEATTEPPTTPETTTEPPTTPEATTEPPTTPEATTEPPTTPEATTEPPTTPEATTEPPTTPEATTEPPTTPEATTEPPTTPEATTEPPTTPEATTEPPTTPEATTEPPTTPEATTEPPTTPEATTEPPTTPEATTEPPTTPEATTEPPTTPEATTKPSTTPTEDPEALAAGLAIAEAENKALETIRNDSVLSEILTAPPNEAITLLQGAVSSPHRDDSPTVAVYLLSSILNRTTGEDIKLPGAETVAVGSEIIEKNLNNEPINGSLSIEGASLLDGMDNFIFNHFREEDQLEMDNLGLRTAVFSQNRDCGDRCKDFLAIDSGSFTRRLLRGRSRLALSIPMQVLHRLLRSNSSDPGLGQELPDIRLGSAIYNNVSGLFPSSMPGRTDTELGSGIVSTGLRCGTERCPTDLLETPVTITIQHSEQVERRLTADNNSEVLCVFLEFIGGQSSDDDRVLSAGRWSDRGCSKNEALSNVSTTVCECYHLTHFAILLSAAPLNSTLSLEIIGYVGVAVSLVAMTLTVITFLLLKPLRNMRNFIHINLCVSLGIAQIIFVAAVDRASGSDDDVPAHCQAVAVLLHYFFLVTFMWMLMEGVVLYVALVRIFVKHKKRYMLAFALISYGLPLLYLGALTLPLGFALDTRPNYGYATACYLNPATKFIWAFIAPVIVIIFINFGFFIMAATIMWRHQRKHTSDKKVIQVKNWFKASLSLVVIMGLTWILGVLIVEVDELLPLAYIYTIMVAFQGLWIFIIFVLLSKQVRDTYKKWWRGKVNESDILSKYFGSKYTLSTKTGNGHSNSTQQKNSTIKLKNIPTYPELKLPELKLDHTPGGSVSPDLKLDPTPPVSPDDADHTHTDHAHTEEHIHESVCENGVVTTGEPSEKEPEGEVSLSNGRTLGNGVDHKAGLEDPDSTVTNL